MTGNVSTAQTLVQSLANPGRFMALSKNVLPWLIAAAAVTVAIGLYLGFTAPADYQQGITVQIMYVHVPFAWISMMCYTLMALSALGVLVWKHPIAEVALRSAAPIGAVFTAMTLATGSIWGKPMWGTWWVWDARLTSVFILFLMYLGIVSLARAIDDPARAGKACAVVALVGFINIPVIKFSVDWWNTLHQPAAVLRLDGPTIDPSMLTPLLICAIGFTLTFASLHLVAMRNEIMRRRIMTLQKLQARGEGNDK